jgi:hypothetical protein
MSLELEAKIDRETEGAHMLEANPVRMDRPATGLLTQRGGAGGGGGLPGDFYPLSIVNVLVRIEVTYGRFPRERELSPQIRHRLRRRPRGLGRPRGRSPAPDSPHRSGPARGGYAPLVFPTVDRFCAVLLHGHAGA